MKNKYENIDSLLDHHAAQQFSMVDADRLYADIRQRLDHAAQSPRSGMATRHIWRWAVGLSAAAAMVTAVFILRPAGKKGIELPSGRLAAVQLTEPDSSTSVSISKDGVIQDVSVVIQPAARTSQVRLAQPERAVAQCSVQIIDQNGHIEEEKNQQPSWVIIIPAPPEEAENDNDQEQADFACLL